MRLGIALILALLAAGCGVPARHATTTPTTPSTTTLPVTTAIDGPKVRHLIPGDLQAVVNLPLLQPITNVVISPGLNASHARPPSASAVPGIVIAASALPPTDPVIDQWQYAPWYTATFTGGGRQWTLDAYLGGLGLLTDDAGCHAMVRLSPHNSDGT